MNTPDPKAAAGSRWTLKTHGVIGPDERLPWPQMLAMGLQHVVAMFGATVLAPLLMGFDPNIAILMSGVGTLIFFFVVGGRVPSYLGSSFAFISVVIAATGYAGTGANANLAPALGGIIVCGALYLLIGLVVHAVGTRWIENLMPPVVTGAVVAVIGLNLAPVAVKGVSASNFDSWMALVTVLCVGVVAVFARGMLQKLLALVTAAPRSASRPLGTSMASTVAPASATACTRRASAPCRGRLRPMPNRPSITSMAACRCRAASVSGMKAWPSACQACQAPRASAASGGWPVRPSKMAAVTRRP